MRPFTIGGESPSVGSSKSRIRGLPISARHSRLPILPPAGFRDSGNDDFCAIWMRFKDEFDLS